MAYGTCVFTVCRLTHTQYMCTNSTQVNTQQVHSTCILIVCRSTSTLYMCTYSMQDCRSTSTQYMCTYCMQVNKYIIHVHSQNVGLQVHGTCVLTVGRSTSTYYMYTNIQYICTYIQYIGIQANKLKKTIHTDETSCKSIRYRHNEFYKTIQYQ